jgi:predicted metal-dependent phosphoesterase TrpH
MRCDLHVHSCHSGPATLPVIGQFAKECYSEPLEVYEVARRRGMDLVTLTDHDTIAGALEIASQPGTFVSEEVTCLLPEGRELHLGVFGIDEAQHQQIAVRRRNAEGLFAYLAEQRIPVCVNHLFSALTGRRQLCDLQLALDLAPLVEARNGMMCEASNTRAAAAGRRAGLAPVGGSDAHTLASVANAYTFVPGAASPEDFLDGLRRGFTIAVGDSGSYARLTADILRVLGGLYGEYRRRARRSPVDAVRFALLLGAAPLASLVPIAAAWTYAHEHWFAWQHYRRFESQREAVLRRAVRPGPFGPTAAPRPAGAP